METENKNSLLLKDFTRFCEDNPDLRFWQALQQWSGHNFILTADSIDNHTGQYMNTKDTYYWSMVTNLPMSFDNDVLQGDRGEQAIARLLEAKGMSEIVITSGNTPEYDISCVNPSGDTVTYEVKTDYYYDTGNMAIEFFCLRRWAPTGILSSKADWYVYIYDQKREAYFIKRQTLLDILTKPDKHSVVNGGDNNQSVMFKLQRHKLHGTATIIDISKYLQ